MRRLKVDLDLDSGSVVIRTTLYDLRDVTTAAVLELYNRVDRCRKEGDEESLSYNKGVLAFVTGIEELIRMQRYPESYEDPIPLINKTVKERWARIEHARREEALLDKIIEEARAAKRAGTDVE